MCNYAVTVHLISESMQVSDALKAEIEQSDVLLHMPAKVKK
jgi:hypothetical protein